ncbi:DUF87 domain-containing protein [candidate division WOR-3 bacterium]|nr:DUF87 domain-containing protein [candidate division WOR-3 bacterium]
MDLLTNRGNLDRVKKAFSGAKKRIWICSGWVRSGTLEQLLEGFKDSKGKVPDIRFIVRLDKKKDLEITDIENFLKLADSVKAEVRYLSTVHAKFNVVDDSYATVGSFNVTGGGYGTENKPGNNDEMGLEITDPEKVKELAQEFESLWEKSFSLDKNVLGFVLGEADNRSADFVCVTEIEYGKYVEIESEDYDGEKRRWLGKIVKPVAHDSEFLPDFTPENRLNPQVAEMYEVLNKKNPAVRFAMMTALINEKGFTQLRSGTIEICKEIVNFGKEEKLERNRVAVPACSVVTTARPEILHRLLGFEEKDLYPVGKLTSNKDVEVFIDYNKILTQHMAVFGTTGSGKSYFTKKFISGIFPWLKNQKGRIVIFDTHGEYIPGNKDAGELYSGIDSKDITVLDEKMILKILEKKILTEESDFDLLFNSAFTEYEKKILLNAFEASTAEISEEKKRNRFIEIIKEKREEEKEIDSQYINQKLEELDNEAFDEKYAFKNFFEKDFKAYFAVLSEYADGKTTEGKQKKKDTLESIFLKIEQDPKFKEELLKHIKKLRFAEISKVFSKTEEKAFAGEKLEKIQKILESGKVGFISEQFIENIKESKIYILNLKNMNSIEDRWRVVSSVCDSVFSEAKKTDGAFKSLLVVEEAHNYAPQSAGRGCVSAKSLLNVTSEGRKFNTGLVAVTQRPANIDKSVIAQCNTSAIFRLINNADIKALDDIIETISKQISNQLPVYETGQCILTGIGVREPVEVDVG